MKCVTVTLNASVDTTYVLEQLCQGDVNRVQRKLAVAGGKGNNVARVLATLGHTVIATGYVGGLAGQYIEHGLQAAGIETAFVPISGESRTSLAIIEQTSGSVTEIREQGSDVSQEDGERFLKVLERLSANVDAVVLSGSLPPGLPDDFYARAIQRLHASSAEVVLDTSGVALRHGLHQRPSLIKPNASEMSALMGRQASDEEQAAYAQRLIGSALAAEGAVLLSLGERGAVLVTRAAKIFASAPRVDVRSPVGSGDAMIAGYLDARAAGMDIEATLRNAVAAGSAAAMHLTPGTVEPSDLWKLRESVRVSQW
ncbi:MAG: 1-phosphofructokinase [Chloroflexota bacterium]|nr:1-phosphofructokinase [Chloroflexota bacterium]